MTLQHCGIKAGDTVEVRVGLLKGETAIVEHVEYGSHYKLSLKRQPNIKVQVGEAGCRFIKRGEK